MKLINNRDINCRAGIVITNGILMLICIPTNMKRNNWLADLPKGHIQIGESPIQAAIRECYEETNILFERYKLTNQIQTTYNNEPLFLFLAKIDGIIPVSLLSCASTFIDSVDGMRKPEVEFYTWINPRTHIHLIQASLRAGIRYYFTKVLKESSNDELIEIEKEIKDCQIAGGMMGVVPQNTISILSLGYKDGDILPAYKRSSKAQDYDSL